MEVLEQVRDDAWLVTYINMSKGPGFCGPDYESDIKMGSRSRICSCAAASQV